MPNADECVGIDWGTAKIAAAYWDSATKKASVLRGDSPHDPVPGRVAFQELHTGEGKEMRALFPTDTQPVSGANVICFNELKRALPSFADSATACFAVTPIFEYWRAAIKCENAGISVSVPATYPRSLCMDLCQAAEKAGFVSCAYINETLAAVLAATPGWKGDANRWVKLEETGCWVCVVDCGSLDLSLGLVFVYRENDELHFSLHAGDCMAGFGAAGDRAAESPEQEIKRSIRTLLRELDVSTPGPRAGKKPVWVLPVGGGPHSQSATKTVLTLVPAADWADPGLDGRYAVAFGAALHQAVLQGKVRSYKIGVLRQRVEIGVKVEDDGAEQFVPVCIPNEPFPVSGERALEIPNDSDQAVDITLCAALPGGNIVSALTSLPLQAKALPASHARLVLVRIVMENWQRGRVEVLAASSGAKVCEGSFVLP